MLEYPSGQRELAGPPVGYAFVSSNLTSSTKICQYSVVATRRLPNPQLRVRFLILVPILQRAIRRGNPTLGLEKPYKRDARERPTK